MPLLKKWPLIAKTPSALFCAVQFVSFMCRLLASRCYCLWFVHDSLTPTKEWVDDVGESSRCFHSNPPSRFDILHTSGLLWKFTSKECIEL